MTETQRRIEAYQKALPGIREKVTAVAMLLALSVIMLTSASFAWLTISRAPEVSSVATNVAANGNLEIALAKDDFSVPDESMVGDSSASKDQNIIRANVTWGNIVNLNDESYGLENIVLRPALISTANNLLDEPLRGANYGSDGRLDQYYNDDFNFTNWVINDDGTGQFNLLSTEKYGVRAISTIKVEIQNPELFQFQKLMDVAAKEQQDTDTLYQAMTTNETYLNALSAVIGQFMTDKLNETDTDIKQHIPALYSMIVDFEAILDDYANTLVAIANAQIYVKYGKDTYQSYTYTKEEFLAATDAELKSNGVSLESLAKYRKIVSDTHTVIYGDEIDYNSEEYKARNSDDDTTNDVAPDCFKDYYLMAVAGEAVKLNYVLSYVNKLVNINSCKIIAPDGTEYIVGSLGMSAALQLLRVDYVNAKITQGVLKDFEELSKCKMCAENVTVSAHYITTVKMLAKTITTSAAAPFTFDTDMAATEANAPDGEETGTAQDTYGMAIDYWVRTNAKGTYLVLEGNVLTKTESVRDTGFDSDGKEVELWTVTLTTKYIDENEKEQVFTNETVVYRYTTGKGTEWRNANTHSTVIDIDGNPVKEGTADVTASTPMERYKEVTTVIGYKGENRVWDSESNEFIDADNTTQGNGSCYVFYAEDPGQQEYCLRLLKNLRVAFLDANEESETYGKLIAVAKLDTENRYEENGKVTLPLVLNDDGSGYLTRTEVTNDGLAICALEKNTPTKLTTIVYLNGTEITNADVLEANDIHGQLNIQFGTTDELEPIRNEELETQTRSVTVVASKDPLNYPATNGTINFDFDDDKTPMTVHLKLAVEGDNPAKIEAFFMRKVNSFQGSREETIEFEKENDGFWYADHTFTAPGEYVMKTVQLDGVDYNLGQTDDTASVGYPHVMITGFNINNFRMYYSDSGREITESKYTIMTGNKSATMDIEVGLKTDQKEPSSIRLQFVEDDGTQVFTTLSKDSTSQSWKGSVTFTMSGVYKLDKIIMDGEYTELPAQYWRELELYLGMNVEINHVEGLISTEFGSENSENVKLSARIFDNSGEEIKYQNEVKLRYGRSAADNFETNLVWDGAQNYYKADLPIAKPGVWKFVSVKIGENVIMATTSTPPTYTRISPDPASFTGTKEIEYAYYVDGAPERLFGVDIVNAESATATLELINEHENNKVYYITANADSTDDSTKVSTFYFNLKTAVDEKGEQTDEVKKGLGKWKVQKLSLVDVCSGTGDNVVLHDGRNPMVFVDEVDHLAAELVSYKVVVTNNEAGDKVVNETLEDNKGFMSSETADRPITVKITDHRGKTLDSSYVTIKDLAIDYVYKLKSSEENGHYLSQSEENDGPSENIIIRGTDKGNGIFETNRIELSYAGEYRANILSFKLVVNNDEKTIKYTSADLAEANPDIVNSIVLPKYFRKTESPTVKITSAYYKSAGTNDTSASTYTDTSTTVYHSMSETEICNIGLTKNYNSAKVTITLSGKGNASSATLTFVTDRADNKVHLYGEGQQHIQNGKATDSYQWTADGNCLRYVGWVYQKENATDEQTNAGTLTATKLILTFGNVNYVFDIADITINNPEQ